MTRYALIRTGVGVDEFRDVDPETIPVHKRGPDGGPLLRPVVEDEKPSFRRELARLATNISVETEAVVVKYAVERLPLDEQRQAVKAECRRRILARFPDWRQANMNARSDELGRIQLGIMIDEAGVASPARALTEVETSEQVAIARAWQWVKTVRAASDKIEALDPIPDDFDADEMWPA